MGLLCRLVFLKRLDQASCRNHPECVWARDQPSFYKFLRQQFAIDPGWPTPTTNVDDFSDTAPPMDSAEYRRLYNATPQSRLARAMGARERRLGGGGGGSFVPEALLSAYLGYAVLVAARSFAESRP